MEFLEDNNGQQDEPSPLHGLWLDFVDGILESGNFTKCGGTPRGHPRLMD